MKRAAVWVRVPKQVRSQRTLDAFLDATERLLGRRAFHEITVNEIIEEAGSSAGSFYARFKDKRALLHELHERLGVRIDAMADRLVPETEGAGAEDAVRMIVTAIVTEHGKSRGVLRAALMESLQDPLFLARAARHVLRLREAVIGVLRPYRGEQVRASFDASVSFGLGLVVAALDQRMFLPVKTGRAGEADEAELIARLTDCFTRYLQLA